LHCDRTDHRKRIEDQWDQFLEVTPEQFRPRIVETLAFEDEDKFPPLHAADAIAWYVRRQFYELTKGNPEYRNEIFEVLFRKEHVSRVFSEADLKMMRAFIPTFRHDGVRLSLPDPTSKVFGSDR